MPGAEGGAADLASGAELVLLIDGVEDVGHGNAQGGDPVGAQPDPHGVVATPEQVDLAYSGNPGQAVDDIDRCIVGQEIIVVAAIGRTEGKHQQRERQ